MGLMECVARATHEAGGTTIGMVPRVVEQGGRVSDYVDVHVACDNLSDRKDLMLAQSDVLIALPGGIGTLDEVFTVMANTVIGIRHQPVVFYNVDGCWDALLAALDNLFAQGLISGTPADYYSVATDINELEQLLG